MNLKNLKKTSQLNQSRGHGNAHARYNSEVPHIYQHQQKTEGARGDQAAAITSSSKGSNNALSGGSRVSGISAISEASNELGGRMIGTAGVTA